MFKFKKLHVNYTRAGDNDESGNPNVYGFITHGVTQRALTLNAIKIARMLGGNILSYGRRHGIDYKEVIC